MEEWEKIYALTSKEEIEEALDFLFDFVDDLLCEGRFLECDHFISIVDLSKLQTDLLLGILVITRAAKDNLKSRERLLIEIEGALKINFPETFQELLQPLR